MDAVRSWAIALCAAAIGCTLLQILAPKDGMGRIFKLLIAAFFLCCLAAPLLQIKNLTRLDFSGLPDEVASGVLQQRVNEQAVSQINAALGEIAGHAVERYGIEMEIIAVETDTSADGSIYIRQVVVSLDKKNANRAAEVRQILESRLGVDVTVQTPA